RASSSAAHASHAARWAAAAVVLTAGAAVVVGEMNAVPVIDERAAAPSAEAVDAPILRVGLGDHVHCALGHTFPDGEPSRDAMRSALGPEYAGLVDAVIPRL